MPTVTRIAGTGHYLPERILTNQDLERMVDTSDAWIRERTGIVRRHIAAPDQTNTDMSMISATQALQAANLKPADIDLIIYGTITPDRTMPSAACTLQAKLGCGPTMAFDVSAACSGFIYSLNLADAMIRTGQYKTALVVGAETLSRIVNFKDRETCILFGDGSGAFVLQAQEDNQPSRFHGFEMHANGVLGDLLSLEHGRSTNPLENEATTMNIPFVHMKGREVFKSAVRAMGDSCASVLKAQGLTAEDVDWFIPHQANIRIIQAVGDYLGIDSNKVIVNIADTANTSSATIPIAFDQAVRDGRITRGQNVLFAAFGGGLTYGATVFRY